MDDVAIALLLLGPPLAYAAAQVGALRAWRGGFRLAAALPALACLAWAGLFAADVARDPTSHNLFPFEVLLLTLASLAYLGLVAAARRWVGAWGAGPG